MDFILTLYCSLNIVEQYINSLFRFFHIQINGKLLPSIIKYVKVLSVTKSGFPTSANSSWLKSGSRPATIISKLPASPTRSGTSRVEPTPASSLVASLSPATAPNSICSASALTRESQTRQGGGVMAVGPEEYCV